MSLKHYYNDDICQLSSGILKSVLSQGHKRKIKELCKKGLCYETPRKFIFRNLSRVGSSRLSKYSKDKNHKLEQIDKYFSAKNTRYELTNENYLKVNSFKRYKTIKKAYKKLLWAILIESMPKNTGLDQYAEWLGYTKQGIIKNYIDNPYILRKKRELELYKIKKGNTPEEIEYVKSELAKVFSQNKDQYTAKAIVKKTRKQDYVVTTQIPNEYKFKSKAQYLKITEKCNRFQRRNYFRYLSLNGLLSSNGDASVNEITKAEIGKKKNEFWNKPFFYWKEVELKNSKGNIVNTVIKTQAELNDKQRRVVNQLGREYREISMQIRKNI